MSFKGLLYVVYVQCMMTVFIGFLFTCFLDGYSSTVQGLLVWFEVDLGFTKLLFIQIDLCVLCVFVLYSRVSLFSCPFMDILHLLPRAAGVPLDDSGYWVSFYLYTDLFM